MWQGCFFFLSLLSRKFDDQLSSNFNRFVILCICWDTPSGKTGLWKLPIVWLSNCQRPVFSTGVSHHNHKITSLWTFGLNWSSKLRENDKSKNTLVGRICVLSDKNKRLLARSLLLFSEKLPLSQKRCYFRGSHFSQCFILSTALQCSLPSQFLS